MAKRKSAVESVDMNPEFWSGKRVLITGHSGFKGGWLSLWLQMMNAKVTGYSLPAPTSPSLFDVARIGTKIHSIIGDIRDFEHLQSVIKAYRPEIVFHLAAQAIVRVSYEDPLNTFDSNIMGTVKLLEAIRSVDFVRAVVVITSDKCYENREWLWGYREIDPMGGFDPYSSSKGCAELITSAYRRSFFNRQSDDSKMETGVATARAGNVIGGGDWGADRLVPDIMKSFMGGKTVIIRHPQAIRPWQYVLEPLRGYLMLAEKLWSEVHRYADAWNFGPDDSSSRSVQWIVERLVTVWGGSATWQLDTAIHPHEAHYLKLDCSKAKTELGWNPLVDLSHSLELVVQWYQVFSEKRDMYEETCRQIANYQQLIKSVDAL
jgi:CDP-glucose 4,6-dehydratase